MHLQYTKHMAGMSKYDKHEMNTNTNSVSRIIERFAVLGRTDLEHLLKSRIEELDRSDYNVAQTLLVLQLLSKSQKNIYLGNLN